MTHQKIRDLIGSGSFQNIALAEQLLIGAARELGEYWFHVLFWEAKTKSCQMVAQILTNKTQSFSKPLMYT